MATIVNINIEDADSVQQVPCEAENLSLLKTSMEGSTVIELNQINGVLTKHSKESSKDFMLLHEAAKTGNVEILKQLLLDKADPTKLDGEKRTPLHWACCFVEKKAEVQTTALAMVKEILQSAKANGSPKLVDYKDYKRQTALELAAKHGNALLIMELLNAGANPRLYLLCNNKTVYYIIRKEMD
ncbi:unnamed protein product [Orchesella dallaii]|uniref:Uncharacterized protein n=1 Tax=Orchesella dallaii TaxID=48710 RepID=A0ABP1RQF0_9HEXA